MKTAKINLYSYEELSKEAKKRAFSDFVAQQDDPFAQAHLGNLLMEELDERGIKYEASSINVLYSLTNSQGDGLMFEGVLTLGKMTIVIEHSGRYYHHLSRTITITDEDGNDIEDQRRIDQIDVIYDAVCKKIERAGYDHIEQLESEENFIETCDVNEYTFEADGTMRNI